MQYYKSPAIESLIKSTMEMIEVEANKAKAKNIDYLKERIEKLKSSIQGQEHKINATKIQLEATERLLQKEWCKFVVETLSSNKF
jgi:hypothetical protein